MDISSLLNQTPSAGSAAANAAANASNANVANGLAATGDVSQGEAAKKNLVGNYDSFLTLLLAQLKHQDPLDPMKGTEFIDSITRLSSVEQSVNQSLELQKIHDLLQTQASGFGSPVSYLGKDIAFDSPAIALSGGQAAFTYNLDTAAQAVDITVKDQDGKVVFTGKGSTTQGANRILWDGTDLDGNKRRDGGYVVSVTATTGGEKTTVPTTAEGIVTGASFEDGEVVLMVGDVRVTSDSIKTVKVVNNSDTSGT